MFVSGEAPSRSPGAWLRRLGDVARGALLGLVEREPTFKAAFFPALVVTAALFTRSPASNYIFDEQEALLANPYVNGKELRFWQVLERDFWGLPPERSIGSYRPLPNVLWRALWTITELPWAHHLLNVVVHAANAALLTAFAWHLTRSRLAAWFSGAAFVTSAVLTETISGVVGLADVLGGLGILLALHALAQPAARAFPLVFGAVLLSFSGKESAIVAVPLLAWTAWACAPLLHPDKPRRWLRGLSALVASALALVAYTYVRRHFFPVLLGDDSALNPGAEDPWWRRAFVGFLRWFQQPRLPQDPINNPLIEAALPERIAGALRVYAHGLSQVLLPWRLSGDYSFPAEPVPARLVFPGSVAGALGFLLPPLLALAALVRSLTTKDDARRTYTVLAVALLWIPVAYFPHSNIPILLPTVRAERFWYVPALGSSLLFGLFFAWLWRTPRAIWVRSFATVLFFGFQAASARAHAFDYSDDLAFWRATRDAVPASAKAQLNYSVMIGARGKLAERVEVNRRAIELAPKWPMAHVYYADGLCRLKRANEAWPHYVRGFELAPNDPNLIALGLQCLWDEQAIKSRERALLDLAERHPGSWLAYLATEIVSNGDKHGGVEPKYRPRGYDEGPKKN